MNVKEQTRKSEAASSKTVTTPYPHKYKTVLCKFWIQGHKCPFGPDCNYAHGHNQLHEKNGNANEDKTAKDTRSEHSDNPLPTKSIPKNEQYYSAEETKNTPVSGQSVAKVSAEQNKSEILIDGVLAEDTDDVIGSGLVTPVKKAEITQCPNKLTMSKEDSLVHDLSPAIRKFAENSMM